MLEAISCFICHQMMCWLQIICSLNHGGEANNFKLIFISLGTWKAMNIVYISNYRKIQNLHHLLFLFFLIAVVLLFSNENERLVSGVCIPAIFCTPQNQDYKGPTYWCITVEKITKEKKNYSLDISFLKCGSKGEGKEWRKTDFFIWSQLHIPIGNRNLSSPVYLFIKNELGQLFRTN